MKDVLKAVLSLVSGVILSRFVWSYTESTHNVERTENSLYNVVCVCVSYPLKHLCIWTVASLLPVSNWKKLELFCLAPKARLSGDFFKQECSICYFLLRELLLISREDWIGKYFLLYILEKKTKQNNQQLPWCIKYERLVFFKSLHFILHVLYELLFIANRVKITQL